MRRFRWQILIALTGAALVIGILLMQSPTPETRAPQPVTGGAYAEALVGRLVRMNPVLASGSQVDRDINRLLFSGLMQYDSRGNLTPDLGNVAVSADATLYTFSLRSDARWHDGQPVTSDDVVYTFSKYQDENYPGPADLHEFWRAINIVRLDDLTVQFQLSEPYAPFLDHVTSGLLPDHLLRGVGAAELVDHPFNLQPVGTGPFRFDRYLLEGSKIVGVSLVAFDDFYEERPFLDRIELRFYENSGEAMQAYQDGIVQGIGYLDAAILEAALKDPGLDVYSARLPEIGMVFLNTTHPEREFLADKNFRKALLLAVNRQWIVDRLLGGQGMVASGPILPGTWAYTPDLQPFDYSVEAANDLLTSLGWEVTVGAEPGTREFIRVKDEEQLALELVYPDEDPYPAIAASLRESWLRIGVDVTLEPAPADTILEDFLESREFEAVLTEINLAGSPDPDPYPFWHDSQTETGQNYSGFADRNISIWLERARTNPDLGQRAELYRSFQLRFQDQVPSLLLYHPVYSFAIDRDILGVTLGPVFDASDRFSRASEWYLLTRRAAASDVEVDLTAASP